MSFRIDLTGEWTVMVYADYPAPRVEFWFDDGMLEFIQWLFRQAKRPPGEEG